MVDADALNPDTVRLIALDWGTTQLRAYALGAAGEVHAVRSAAQGVMAVSGGAFEPALRALVGDWLQACACPVIASGMIGSRQGWREAPYLDGPAGVAQAAARLTAVRLGHGGELFIVPGLRCVGADGEFDVMRGEETQVWGAGLANGAWCVLPGTHAKWVRVGAEGCIDAFRTYMTGELYALLTQHGILGRLMAFGHSRPAAFAQGVRLGLAEHARATHIIFSARTAGLMGRLDAEALPDFLSGLLIGVEIGSECAAERPSGGVTVLGDATLVARYVQALGLAGLAAQAADDNVTTRGLWRVAQAAALVKEVA